MTKNELRITYKQQRAALSNKDRMKMDDLLLIQFQQLAFEDAGFLLTYRPMPHAAEPNTLLFTRYLRHMLPGLTIAYPVTDFESHSMQAFAVGDDTHFHKNNFGITEPAGGNLLAPELIDIVFVPLLICDRYGYRVGYGKGFYDRYLAQCKPSVIKIGFSYFDPVDKIDDAQPFDVPLNYCITPFEIYEMPAC